MLCTDICDIIRVSRDTCVLCNTLSALYKVASFINVNVKLSLCLIKHHAVNNVTEYEHLLGNG
jgi:hypothetical protein